MCKRAYDRARFAEITGLLPIGDNFDPGEARAKFYEELDGMLVELAHTRSMRQTEMMWRRLRKMQLRQMYIDGARGLHPFSVDIDP